MSVRKLVLLQVLGDTEVERRLANWHGNDPFALWRCACKDFDPLQDVVDRSTAREGWRDFLQAFPVHMRVCVNEAGCDQAAAGIDPRGVFIRQNIDLACAAYSEDFVLGDSNRLGHLVAGGQGCDFAVLNDLIGDFLHSVFLRIRRR